MGEIWRLLTDAAFNNPNTLEVQMAAQAVHCEAQPFLLCFNQSAAFSAPLNKVQAVYDNRASHNPASGAEALKQRFSEGQRVDVTAYAGFVPNACHQEIELKTQPMESRRPVVSVIIPCYKQAQYLPEAVASVLAQSFADWEIIIINDGSPDSTSEVARRLAARRPRQAIRLLERANGGLAEARNSGIRLARGEYILPLDADDQLAPALLEKTVSCLQADPGVAIVYTDTLCFGTANHTQRWIDFDFTRLCAYNQMNYCSLFRREAWEKAGGYKRNMTWGYEDWDFWISCGEAGFKAKHLPEPLFLYRVKPESMLTKAAEHDLELRAQIVLNHPGLYNETTQHWARSILAKPNSASAEPAASAPHEILCRDQLLADFRKYNAYLDLEIQTLQALRSKELATKDAPVSTKQLFRILKAYGKRKLGWRKPQDSSAG
jgi:glycosyltransferase involved in cell wall biosynthesis